MQILGPQYNPGNYSVSASYFRARNGSTLLLPWQLLNSFEVSSTNFLLLLLTVLLSMSRRDCYDEMICASAKYKLFTFTRQFCANNITLCLSYDKIFRICHAVNSVLVHVLTLSQTYPFPFLRTLLFNLLLCTSSTPLSSSQSYMAVVDSAAWAK